MLALEALSKSYPQSGFKLGPINLKVEAGSSVAILGKNGAGKSTLFQLLTGNLDAESGTITLNGERMHRAAFALKREVGYLPQHLELPRWVSAWDLMHYAARLLLLDDAPTRIASALDFWDCASYQHKPLAACSYGMQKRVGLALASFHEPRLLILDEPFSGLDLYHIRALETTMRRRLNPQQITILSTHVAATAAQHCDSAYSLADGDLQPVAGWAESDFAQRIAGLEALFFPPQAKGL